MSGEKRSSRAIEHWLQLPTLRLLVAIADTGSLSAGARIAGIAQSNATRSLRSMERRLGYTLLIRSTRGSKLTPEGVLTVEWARNVLDSLEEMSAGAAALADSGNGELVVGASMTVAEYLAPAWIAAFHKSMPRTQTTLRIMNSRQVIEAIHEGDLSLGFVETPDIPRDLQSAIVWTDQLVLIAGRDHPWAQRSAPVTLAELARTPLVEREAGSGTRAFLEQVIGADRPSPIVELNSNSAICQSVIAGLGPAVLSRLAVEGALRSGLIVEVSTGGERLWRDLKAIWVGPRMPFGAAGNLLDMAIRNGPL